MANKGQTLIGWLAATGGIVLLYGAYKNTSPLSILTGQLTGAAHRTVINPNAGIGAVGTASNSLVPTASPAKYDGTNAASPRIAAIANRSQEPTLVPIPWQPNATLDIEALASLAKVQAMYGKPLFVTSGYRSYASQATAHASDPSRFAPADSSLHTVGLAVDFNTNSVNVEDPKLVDLMTANRWYRVGKSGHMHWSYGVPG